MRDTARAPQPPTYPPTGHQISLHGLAQIDQKWQFWVKFGRFWAKCAKNGNILPKMTKNADFGPNLAVFGPKILIFMLVSKSFGTNITENHFGNLSALFFGQALDQMGQKCRYLAQNASFGPNLAVFGPEIQFFGGRE